MCVLLLELQSWYWFQKFMTFIFFVSILCHNRNWWDKKSSNKQTASMAWRDWICTYICILCTITIINTKTPYRSNNEPNCRIIFHKLLNKSRPKQYGKAEHCEIHRLTICSFITFKKNYQFTNGVLPLP